MPTVNVTIRFTKGYIADPYWPEREKLINIQKESGMNRARTNSGRAKALSDYLASKNMTVEDYELLKKLADRLFYKVLDGDVLKSDVPPGTDLDEVIVPAHQIHGALANAADLATSSIRIAKPENIRTVVQASDFHTGLHETDALLWERFARHQDTNQRGLRQNYYLPAGTQASGTLTFSEHHVDANRLYTFLEYCGRDVGVGASRKMGWGRFEITDWKLR